MSGQKILKEAIMLIIKNKLSITSSLTVLTINILFTTKLIIDKYIN